MIGLLLCCRASRRSSGGAATDISLDAIEVGDAQQGFTGDRRLGRETTFNQSGRRGRLHHDVDFRGDLTLDFH
jgi:hypothetical protein